MISAILIYGRRGEILASRIYRPGLRRAITDAFRVEVISSEESTPPVLMLGSTTFLHIMYNKLYVVAVTRYDVDAISVFEFLYELCEICRSRFGQFDENTCYTYVTQIYEILDELVDFGFVQNREDSVLDMRPKKLEVDTSDLGVVGSLRRTLSTKPSIRRSESSQNSPTGGSPLSNQLSGSGNSPFGGQLSSQLGGSNNNSHSSLNHKSPSQTPSENIWRKKSVKHRRNEAYLDVIETLSCVIGSHDEECSVDGVVRFKAHLSGIPLCAIAFNRVALLGKSQLHSCVDAPRFHSSGQIVFTPPEGSFDLLRYHATGVRAPIKLEARRLSSVETMITVKCTLEARKTATDVVVSVPLTGDARLKSSTGKAKMAPEHGGCEWRVGRLTGQSEATLNILFSDNNSSCSGVASAHFTLPMHTCSGLKVDSLTITEDSHYSTMKWVRYESKGTSEIRI